MNTNGILAIALSACASAYAIGQLAPQPASAGAATTAVAKVLSPDVEAVLSRYASSKSVKVLLETEKSIENKAVRMELVMTSDRRFAQRMWDIATPSDASLSDQSSTNYSEDNVQYFAFCDHDYLKARRGTLDMYIRHDAKVGWEPAPGPTLVALAPWSVLRAIAMHVDGTVTTEQSGGSSLVTLGDTKHVLTFDSRGTLRSWTSGSAPSHEVTEYFDSTTSLANPALPARIVQQYPQRGDKHPAQTVEWRVLSAEYNPRDAEERLDFAPIAAKFKRFDPDTGNITNPDGSSGGREIQPAAMAVDAWDRQSRTKAWTSVFKWGSIATGMFVLAFVMELIRRRL